MINKQITVNTKSLTFNLKDIFGDEGKLKLFCQSHTSSQKDYLGNSKHLRYLNDEILDIIYDNIIEKIENIYIINNKSIFKNRKSTLI